MKHIVVLGILLMAAASQVSANTPVQLDIAKGDITAQRNTIDKAIVSEEYVEFVPAERAELATLLIEIGENPSAADQNLLKQKRANEILAKAFADSRMICRQVKEVGSNMSKRSCMTVAAKRRASEQAKMNQNAPIRID
jgi:hypothetical protein